MADLTWQLGTFLRRPPTIGRGVYIAATGIVLGDVTLGDFSSVWYHAVLRGDINRIVVGHHSNIQDNAVVHLADEFPCLIGSYVTIGHSAIIHACTVSDECLVGMGATILDGAVIGAQSIVGANALVTQEMQVPPGSLVLGSPARVKRALTDAERGGLRHWAEKYVVNAAYCLEHRINLGAPMPPPPGPPSAGELPLARDGVGHRFREGPTPGSSRSKGSDQAVDLPGPRGPGLEALQAKDSGVAGAPG